MDLRGAKKTSNNGGQSGSELPVGFQLIEASFFWVVTISSQAPERLLTPGGGRDGEASPAMAFQRRRKTVRRSPSFSNCICRQRKQKPLMSTGVFRSLDPAEFWDPDQGESFGSRNEAALLFFMNDFSLTALLRTSDERRVLTS